MKGKRSNILFSLFALFVIFSDEVFFCLMAASGTVVESGMKSIEAILVAAIAYTLLFEDIVKHKLNNRNFRQLLSLFFIFLLYFLTQFLFLDRAMVPNYIAHMLVYGAMCIPACYVGLKIAKIVNDSNIVDYLPFFVIPVALIVSSAVVVTSVAGSVLSDEESAFNYQSASYYLAYCFSYAVFFVFLYKNRKKDSFSKLIFIIMFVMLFVCGIGCVLGGGRGAFIYLVLIGAYLIHRIFHRTGKSKVGTFFILTITGLLAMFLAIKFSIFDSAGFNRVSNFLTTDDSRQGLWLKALDVFMESPIFGYGLGSIWWTVGFYSHNMFTDILAETGIIGAAIFLPVLGKTLVTLFRRSKFCDIDMLLLLIFSGVFFECTFSGYWISAPKMFLVFGYVFGLSKVERRAKVK